MIPSAVGVAIRAAVERLGTNAAVSVPAIALAYEIGEWLIHYRRVDPVSVDDGTGVLGQMFVSFFKNKTDLAGAAEDMAYALHKDLRDGAGLTDIEIFSFFKALANSVGAQEAHAFAVNKPLVEMVANTEDHAYLLTKKAKEDSVGLTDLQVQSFFKALIDVSGVSDALASAIDKPFVDAGAASDFYSNMLTKIVSDRISVTDDIDGAASILDDQVMVFTKGSTDIVGVSDEIYIIIEVLREFFDTAAASDMFAIQLAKTFNELASLSDDQTLSFNKGLSDPLLLQEMLSRSFEKALLDNPSVADSRAFATSTVKSDVASFTDVGSVQNQSYGDTSYFSENYVGVFRTF